MTDQELPAYMETRWLALAEQAASYQYHLDFPFATEADHALRNLIHGYAAALYDKARRARDKYDFHPFGWAFPNWEVESQRGLAEHVAKGDPRDCSVFNAFQWFHGWPTAAPGSAPSLLLQGEDAASLLDNIEESFEAVLCDCGRDCRECSYDYLPGQRLEWKENSEQAIDYLVQLLRMNRAAPAPAVVSGGGEGISNEQLATVRNAVFSLEGHATANIGAAAASRKAAPIYELLADLKKMRAAAPAGGALVGEPTAKEIDELVALEARATKGKWLLTNGEDGLGGYDVVGIEVELEDEIELLLGRNNDLEHAYGNPDDLRLIAALRNAAPRLLAAARPSLVGVAGPEQAELAHQHYWIEYFGDEWGRGEENWELATGTRTVADVPRLLAREQQAYPKMKQWRVREEGKYERTWPELPAAPLTTPTQGADTKGGSNA